MATKESKTSETAQTVLTPNQHINYVEFITQAGDNLLNILNAHQDQALKFAKSLMESLPKAAQHEVPKVDVSDLEVPSAREVVEVGFTFADKYLANQKAHAEKFLALTEA